MDMKVIIFLSIGFHSQILSLSTILLFFEIIKYVNAGFLREKKENYSWVLFFCLLF